MKKSITAMIIVLFLLPVVVQAQQPWRDKGIYLNPRLEKALMTTDALQNPEKLREVAKILGEHGLTKEKVYFSGLAKEITRKAEVSTFQNLLLGDIDNSIDAARISGHAFADRPVKVKPNDPDDDTWRIQYDGSPETVVNARKLFDMYSQIAQSEGYNLERELRGIDDQKERKEREELLEEQRRALQTNELLTLRFLSGDLGSPPVGPLPPIGYGYR